MQLRLEGRARRVGDDVNTEYLVSSTRKRETIDPHLLCQHLLETVLPAFAASVRPGDLLVAGRNFGCGSAMEVAVTVVLAAGIPAVLARSFARTYYRNAINNGLLPVECDTSAVGEGDRLIVDAGETFEVRNLTTGQLVAGRALPRMMREILAAGGLVPYLRAHPDFPG